MDNVSGLISNYQSRKLLGNERIKDTEGNSKCFPLSCVKGEVAVDVKIYNDNSKSYRRSFVWKSVYLNGNTKQLRVLLCDDGRRAACVV